jgi:hypothetical protein
MIQEGEGRGQAVEQVVEALYYKQKDRGFDSPCFH